MPMRGTLLVQAPGSPRVRDDLNWSVASLFELQVRRRVDLSGFDPSFEAAAFMRSRIHIVVLARRFVWLIVSTCEHQF